MQQTDKILIAKNSSSCKDTNKSHAQKSSSWSWKDKLKLSRRVWSASNLESFIDISFTSYILHYSSFCWEFLTNTKALYSPPIHFRAIKNNVKIRCLICFDSRLFESCGFYFSPIHRLCCKTWGRNTLSRDGRWNEQYFIQMGRW